MGGVAMTIKTVGRDGKEKWVKLTGAEKAMVCQMMWNFGVHEGDVVEIEPPRGGVKGRAVEGDEAAVAAAKQAKGKRGKLSEMLGDLPPLLADRSAVEPPKKWQALMCHCCEAAEIVFEDIDDEC